MKAKEGKRIVKCSENGCKNIGLMRCKCHSSLEFCNMHYKKHVQENTQEDPRRSKSPNVPKSAVLKNPPANKSPLVKAPIGKTTSASTKQIIQPVARTIGQPSLQKSDLKLKSAIREAILIEEQKTQVNSSEGQSVHNTNTNKKNLGLLKLERNDQSSSESESEKKIIVEEIDLEIQDIGEEILVPRNKQDSKSNSDEEIIQQSQKKPDSPIIEPNPQFKYNENLDISQPEGDQPVRKNINVPLKRDESSESDEEPPSISKTEQLEKKDIEKMQKIQEVYKTTPVEIEEKPMPKFRITFATKRRNTKEKTENMQDSNFYERRKPKNNENEAERFKQNVEKENVKQQSRIAEEEELKYKHKKKGEEVELKETVQDETQIYEETKEIPDTDRKQFSNLKAKPNLPPIRIPEIIDSLTFEEAKHILEEMKIKPIESKKSSGNLFVCGCSKKTSKESKLANEAISKLVAFGNSDFDSDDAFHTSLMESFVQKSGNEDMPQCISHPHSPLAFFLYLYLDSRFSNKLQHIEDYCKKNRATCPFKFALLETVSVFVDVLSKKKLSNKVFTAERPFDSCLLLYAGLTFKWFDFFVDNQMTWENCDVVSKKVVSLAGTNGTSLVALATHYKSLN